MTSPATPSGPVDLRRYAWLSIAAAVATIALKSGAWWITGSVGLLSDAAESLVNLAAAFVALYALTLSLKPPDQHHLFGHTKAEYFSAAAEGQMIFVAALVIVWTAVERLLNPQPLENVGIGLVISCAAAAINGGVALVLGRAGRRYRSLTLIADGRHLMTDVWTSVGVVVGVLLVAVTKWERLDAIVALGVGVNILYTGWRLLHESANGLMDRAWSQEDTDVVTGILNGFVSRDVAFHGLRTRVAGRRRFAEVHVLVPGEWTVQRGHDLSERIEAAVDSALEGVHLVCHVEPSEDPRAYDDYPAHVEVGPPA